MMPETPFVLYDVSQFDKLVLNEGTSKKWAGDTPDHD